jgi:hypothetical protein
LWNEGTWISRVRIWPIDRYEAGESLIRPSLEARFPLQAVCVTGRGGKLPKTSAGLSLDRKPYRPGEYPKYPSEPGYPPNGWRRNALVTAFGPNPDGSGTLLRLWELAGQSGECQVTLPAGLKVAQVQPVDLRGRPSGAAIPVKDGHFTAPLKAFAPSSFVLAP